MNDTELWTLDKRVAYCFAMHINFGGKGFWCKFDFVADPDPAVEGVATFINPSADEETVKWFPDIVRGIEKGYTVLQQYYKRTLVHIRVEITKIYTHPNSTTARGCEYYGKCLMDDLGRHFAVRVPDADEPVVVGQ